MSSISSTCIAEASMHLPAGAACAAGEQPNGQHHLLRHVLSPQQCSDALRHFGTTDSKAAARMVNRMSQRELRDMFAKVYSVHTNSNNNTWLRRKLLEAVGASRRFYNAANKTGRPKGRRAPPAAGTTSGHTSSGGSHPSATHTHHAPAPQAAHAHAHLAGGSGSPLSLHPAAHHRHHPHPGPALPAGSPRALAQRLRGGPSCHAPLHHYQHAYAFPQPNPYHHHSGSGSGSEEEDASSEGSEAAPHSLAPHHALSDDSASPTCAWTQQQAIQQQQCAPQHPLLAGSSATYSRGSNSSLLSSQFPAPAALQAAAAGLPPIHPSAFQAAAAAAAPLRSPATAAAGVMAQQRAAMPPPMSAFAAAAVQQQVTAAAPAAAAAQQGQAPVQQQGLPRIPSFNTLSALMTTGAPAPPTAATSGSTAAMLADLSSMASLQLQPMPSSELGLGLLGPADSCVLPGARCKAAEAAGGGSEEWLTWDDWQLPSLF